MLMKIGMVECDLAFNIDKVRRETRADFAEKPVVGRMPPLEPVGEGPETLALSGRLLPAKLGGLSTLEVLRAAQRSQAPQLVVRGDGAVLGFFVVETLSDEHAFVDAHGVGQVVDVQATLKRAAAPQPADFFAALFRIVGL